jgi:hypothetical protein
VQNVDHVLIISDRPMTEEDSSDDQAYRRVLDIRDVLSRCAHGARRHVARFIGPRRSEAGRGADVSRGPGKEQRATGAYATSRRFWLTCHSPYRWKQYLALQRAAWLASCLHGARRAA